MPLTPLQPRQHEGAVLVTGAAGFIGARVVDEIARSGVDVVAIHRPAGASLPRAASPSATLAVSRNVTFIECDMLNQRAVADIVAHVRPSACIHAAWDVSDPNYMASPANQRWVHASLHLSRCLMDNGCQWLGVCGTHIEPSGTCAPPNRYAAAKITLRHRLCDMTSGTRSSMRVCWFHIFQPYGPGERAHRLVPSMIASVRDRQPFELKQPNALRDFIHVDDIARAITAALAAGASGRLDVGTGCVRSLRDVAQVVERLAGVSGCIRWSDRPRNEWSIDSVNRVANIAPLQTMARWRPTIDFESAVGDLVRREVSALRASA